MTKFFPPKRNFSSLSVKDLLDAREAYHVHLAHLENVIGTAIGRYRIRKEDPDRTEPKKWRSRKEAPPRTLSNTVVKEWSWPCVLVFVTKWLTQKDFVKQEIDQVVPRYLYLADGRVVPTCVVLAEQERQSPPPLQDLAFPADLVGGGYPLITEVQNQQHVGSIGCLVTDGDSYYALTNRHVTGTRRVEEETGREILTMIRGVRQRIGETSVMQLGKKPFQEVYPNWPGRHTHSNLDAGLIRIDDLNYWTAQVFGIGEIDDPVDLNVNSISLDLIGCPLRAFGGASGEMFGEIKALFYRYKSIGGVNYVSDLLVGERSTDPDEHAATPAKSTPAKSAPVRGPLKTRPGDSGTLWFFDEKFSPEEAREEGRIGDRARRFRPVALQWGGQTLMETSSESQMQFALATFLSTICRELDVDVVPDWNIGHSEYWGKLGHYKIAAKACELATDPKLRKLLLANVDRIGFDDAQIENGKLKKIDPKFVPLADVPDLVWRATRKKDEGNHFADMDEPGKGEFKGKTLLKLCEDPANVDIEVWNKFYDSLGVDFKRGALPFRVWQLYNQMVESVKAGNVAEYICAAGILAHYVGDACQPLHVSFLHHGRPGHDDEKEVHAIYETRMLDRFAADVIAGVNENLKSSKAKADVKGGHAAATSVIELMRNTIQTLPPMKIITAHNAETGRQRTEHMFKVLGPKTTEVMASGALRLASLWASAWKEGGGGKIPAAEIGPVDKAALKKLYNKDSFLEAFRLKDPKFADALQ
ncbi:MAG: hypothetical protein QOD75_2173 [Blastocatellia bacterium]|nr:hypothetical protein [Blastocatellia bacterium]